MENKIILKKYTATLVGTYLLIYKYSIKYTFIVKASLALKRLRSSYQKVILITFKHLSILKFPTDMILVGGWVGHHDGQFPGSIFSW